jgi:nitrile hydratase accessory protein
LNKPEDNRIRPFVSETGDAVFDEAWQAQVLAMVESLISSSKISATDWSSTLGSELQKANASGAPDNSETYYKTALSALECLLLSDEHLTTAEITERKEGWEEAYLSTPHGQPVALKSTS